MSWPANAASASLKKRPHLRKLCQSDNPGRNDLQRDYDRSRDRFTRRAAHCPHQRLLAGHRADRRLHPFQRPPGPAGHHRRGGQYHRRGQHQYQSMHVSRLKPRGQALMILALDEALPDKVLKTDQGHPRHHRCQTGKVLVDKIIQALKGGGK